MPLNEQQQKAVNHRDGPCLVISVPGSGKTTMLVKRTSHLIANDADPTKILCITFTNKAAKEMKERICSELGLANAPFFIGTFHSLCAMILRKAGNRIGYKPSLSIIDEDEQEDLVKKILRAYASLEEDQREGEDEEDANEEKKDIKKIIFHLNDARENCETEAQMAQRFSDKFPDLPIAWRVAQDYLKELVKQNVIDFSGLLYDTIRLFENHKDILIRLQKRFDYIQIDEVQDTNYAQFKLINLLGAEHRNIMMVGDISQSIYAFRGARYKNIVDFLDMNKDCVQIPLTKNYRSTPEIIAVADKLINHNKSHMKVKFETDNPSGQGVEVMEHDDSQEEAVWLAQTIKDEIKHGRSASDIAVFYRLNKLSMELQIELAKEGVPFVVVGGPSFFARSEIKDVLTALRYLVNHEDTLAFHRIAGLLRGVGDATIGTIEAVANKYNVTTFEACKNIETYKNTIKNDYMQTKADYESRTMMGEKLPELEPMIKVTPKVVAAAKTLYDAFKFDYSKMHAGDALVQVVANLDYNGYLDRKYGADAYDRKDNVKELINNATSYGEKKSRSIERYLQTVALSSSSDKDTEVAKVTLMTLHACKGLEFPRVFMVGVEHNILPHGRALMDAENPLEALEEERRICYVGFTRAKQKLTVSYCTSRRQRSPKGFMERKPSWPSQFLKESGLIDEKAILAAHNVDPDDPNGRRLARRAMRDGEFPDDGVDRYIERDTHA